MINWASGSGWYRGHPGLFVRPGWAHSAGQVAAHRLRCGRL